MKRGKLLLGLGTLAALLATPLVVSACKSTGGHEHYDNTMMKRGILSKKQCSACSGTGGECSCKDSKCGEGSCRGGDSAECGYKTCGASSSYQ